MSASYLDSAILKFIEIPSSANQGKTNSDSLRRDDNYDIYIMLATPGNQPYAFPLFLFGQRTSSLLTHTALQSGHTRHVRDKNES